MKNKGVLPLSKKKKKRPFLYHIFKFFFSIFALFFSSCFIVNVELNKYPLSRLIGNFEKNSPSNKAIGNLTKYDLDDSQSYLDFAAVTVEGETVLLGGVVNIIFYLQNDERWANKNYGPRNSIAQYGCGPTVLAMIVSSMTNQRYTPDEMATWAYKHGFFSQNSGSYHSIIPDGAKSFGLTVESIQEYTPEKIIETLYTGKIVVLLMDQGHFTQGGHFIILRGTTLDGQILIADPQSLENSNIPWDPAILIEEMKYASDAGGPMWAIGMH